MLVLAILVPLLLLVPSCDSGGNNSEPPGYIVSEVPLQSKESRHCYSSASIALRRMIVRKDTAISLEISITADGSVTFIQRLGDGQLLTQEAEITEPRMSALLRHLASLNLDSLSTVYNELDTHCDYAGLVIECDGGRIEVENAGFNRGNEPREFWSAVYAIEGVALDAIVPVQSIGY